MKTIGLLGGMSWESSAEYYWLINRHSKALHGGHHNAKSVLVTVDFAEIEALQSAHDWPALGACMADAARRLEAAGADFVVLAINTMHRVADSIAAAVTLPFLHVADPAGAELLLSPVVAGVGDEQARAAGRDDHAVVAGQRLGRNDVAHEVVHAVGAADARRDARLRRRRTVRIRMKCSTAFCVSLVCANSCAVLAAAGGVTGAVGTVGVVGPARRRRRRRPPEPLPSSMPSPA
ncbi:aspartate/glutamate racemase family protein [Burkholderia glumae]|uniref:aspartate/glutamate racemase family protein n=1 Tax=Burkholderia glumae TaxID=337 RepID=UPI0021509223|nr:aspartate/glutamate racemase family protein [Burkholderia glumae]